MDGATTAPPEFAAEAASQFVAWLQAHDRLDLAQRVATAAAKARRPSTVVCVVGEFKQGKSSLVNSLLGHRLCPVDDDLATSAITLVRHGDQPQAVVYRRTDDGLEREVVPLEQIDQWVSEVGNPGNERRVERLELTSTSPVLSQGLVLVDTPGMGGLGAGHAAATLAFLPFADGLIFVSDATAELSRPEIDFLQTAMSLCPTVIVALTKIDISPAWQRIAELDRQHLLNVGLDIPIIPTSSMLRTEALQQRDRELNDLSRIPDLVTHLGEDVIRPAKLGAAGRATAECGVVMAQIREMLRVEREVVADPKAGAEALKSLEETKRRIEHLRGPAAKWPQLVGDRIGDLSTEVSHRFRTNARVIGKEMDERIETLTRGDQWDEVAREVQTAVADAVTQVFVELETGRNALHDAVLELIDDENLQLSQRQEGAHAFDVSDYMRAKPLEADVAAGKKIFTTTITTVRGAQGGIYMFGMLGSFLPAAAGLLIASNPVLLGVGAVFGSMGLFDDRKRKVQLRRQTARAQVRQFLDDVQFEMGNQITNLVRDIQREARDDVSERLGELQRTYGDTINRSQADGALGNEERTKRVAQIDGDLGDLDRFERALTSAEPAGALA